MRKTAAVVWKEVRSYFSSPMAYAVAGVFVGLTGYFFVDGLSGPIPEATVRPYTDSATFVLVLLAPLLTMRLLAEEHKLGTSVSPLPAVPGAVCCSPRGHVLVAPPWFPTEVNMSCSCYGP